MIARLLILLLAVSVQFAHGDPIDEFGGPASKENQVRWIWKYLGEFITSCERSGEECQDPEIKATLQDLRDVFPQTPQTADSDWGQNLRFVSEVDRPDLFTSESGETHRVAVTGNIPWREVYINRDRIDLPNSRWVGILTHELVHHLGIEDGVSRLPDRVGAAVAAFTERNWTERTMAEFGHPEYGILIFNDPSHDRPVRAMVNVLMTIDNDFTLNSNKPVCEEGEQFLGQWSEDVLWQVIYLRGDRKLAKLRSTAILHSRCGKPDGQERIVRAVITGLLDLNFDETFSVGEAWWDLPSRVDPQTLAWGYITEAESRIELNRTFAIVSVEYEKPTVQAGETWRGRMMVRSLDGFRPSSCGITIAGSRWAFNRSYEAVLFDVVSDCRLTDLGGDKWQIDFSHQIPPNAQADYFYPTMLYVNSANDARFGFTAKPAYVEVLQSAPREPLAFVDWQVEGADERIAHLGIPLRRSYRVEYGKPFWIEFDLNGDADATEQYFDIDLLANTGFGTVFMPWNPNLDSMTGQILLRHEQVRLPDGKLRLRYQLSLPRRIGEVDVYGFKLRRVYARTDDYSFAEIEIPYMLEAVFFTDEFKF